MIVNSQLYEVDVFIENNVFEGLYVPTIQNDGLILLDSPIKRVAINNNTVRDSIIDNFITIAGGINTVEIDSLNLINV